MKQLVCISPLIYSHPIPFSGWTLQWIACWNARHFRYLISQGSWYHKQSYRSEGGGGVEPRSGGTFQCKKNYMAKWHQFRLFSAQHVTKYSYIDAQSHQLVLWWFPACCLPGQASWSYLQTTWAPVNTWQVREWGLSKSRLLNLLQWYKHELLVYCCIRQMAVKSEIWNCACIRPLLANLVTWYLIHKTFKAVKS